MKHTHSPRWVAYAPQVNNSSPIDADDIETFNIYKIAFDVHNDFLFEARNKKIQLLLNTDQAQGVDTNREGEMSFDFDFDIEGGRCETYSIISQMVKNALAQTLEGVIEIRVKPSINNVIVEVNDTGIGVSPDQNITFVETMYRGQICKITYVQDPSTSLASVADQLFACHAQMELQVNEGEGMKRRLSLPRSMHVYKLKNLVEFAVA